jgi:hypothetical protein
MTKARTLDLDTFVLSSGSHKPNEVEIKACVMEAVAYIAGEPWSDHPKCVDPTLTSFGIRLNDRFDSERRQLLKPLIPKLIGTADDGHQDARRWMAGDWYIRVAIPYLLDACELTEYAEQLRALAPVVDLATSKAAAKLSRSIKEKVRTLRAERRASLVEWLAPLIKAKRASAGDAGAAWDAGAAGAAGAAWDADREAIELLLAESPDWYAFKRSLREQGRERAKPLVARLEAEDRPDVIALFESMIEAKAA